MSSAAPAASMTRDLLKPLAIAVALAVLIAHGFIELAEMG